MPIPYSVSVSVLIKLYFENNYQVYRLQESRDDEFHRNPKKYIIVQRTQGRNGQSSPKLSRQLLAASWQGPALRSACMALARLPLCSERTFLHRPAPPLRPCCFVQHEPPGSPASTRLCIASTSSLHDFLEHVAL